MVHVQKYQHLKSYMRKCVRIEENDPSAGSPTETLLRLLLPLDNLVCKFSQSTTIYARRWILFQSTHQLIQSVGATGGVYKGQGRIQCTLVTDTY